MYKRDSIELLRELVDPRDILSSVGGVAMNALRDNGHEVRCPCPIHGGDNAEAFSWKKSDGIWTCFTNNCGAGLSRDVYTFVSMKLGLSFVESVKYVADMYNFKLDEETDNSYSAWRKASNVLKTSNELNAGRLQELKPLDYLPGYFKDGFSYIEDYLKQRNYLDTNALKQFNLYPCVDKNSALRMGIPAYDENGQLVGVNARRMDGILTYPGTVPKYLMVAGYKKASVLYNLHLAKQFAPTQGLIVVEGELSCIRLHTYGFVNAVSCTGASLSLEQVTLIGKYTNKVLFLLEEGEAAYNGMLKSIERLFSAGITGISIAKLQQGDADDNSRAAIIQAFENASRLSITDIRNLLSGDLSI